MSHISKVELKITSLDNLKRACMDLGCQFMENQTTFKWWNKSKDGKCDHAIKVPGADYEVGVIQDKDNPREYHLEWDNYAAGGLVEKLGPDAGKLRQAYALNMAKFAALNQGYTALEQRNEDGSISLQITL